MALIKCPECGHEISDSAPSCPHCGFVMTKLNDSKVSIEMAEAKRLKRSKLGTRLLVIGVLIFFAVCIYAGVYYQEDLGISAGYYFGKNVSKYEYEQMLLRTSIGDFLFYVSLGMVLIGMILKIIYRRKIK